MTGTEIVLLALAAVFVLMAGVLVCVEAALSWISRIRAEELVADGVSGARRLRTIVAEPPRYLNVLLLLRMAGELTATALVTVVLREAIADPALALLAAIAIMIVTGYVLIGVAPRTLGRQHADWIAPRAAFGTVALTRVLGPIPQLLILLGNALTPGRGFREGPFASEAELRDLVDLAEERQVIEHGEREMIHSVFELGDTLVRAVMVPRPEIVFIERTKTVRQGLNLALRSGFSRVPVAGENEDDVVGIAFLKDLARRVYDGRESDKVEEVMRSAPYVPDSIPVDDLLREMQAGGLHMAVVIDEYGGTAGLVTIEDILEEIVGEITDESDREVPPVEEIDDQTVRVLARLPVEDLAERFDVDLPDDDVETVGGLLASLLGRVPIPGATVTVADLTLTAESSKGRRNRIGTVLVEYEPVAEVAEAGPAGDADDQGDTGRETGRDVGRDAGRDTVGNAVRRSDVA